MSVGSSITKEKNQFGRQRLAEHTEFLVQRPRETPQPGVFPTVSRAFSLR